MDGGETIKEIRVFDRLIGRLFFGLPDHLRALHDVLLLVISS